MILQIGTALAIGAYVVLSKDAQPKRPDATPRESFQHLADHLDRRSPRLTPNLVKWCKPSEIFPRPLCLGNGFDSASTTWNVSGARFSGHQKGLEAHTRTLPLSMNSLTSASHTAASIAKKSRGSSRMKESGRRIRNT
jgi:hypothetical protein